MAKEGKDTTEFQEAKNSNWLTVVGMVLSGLILYAPKLLELAPENSKWAIIGGAVLAVASIAYKALVSLGYIKSRTDVKVAEAVKETAPSDG